MDSYFLSLQLRFELRLLSTQKNHPARMCYVNFYTWSVWYFL